MSSHAHLGMSGWTVLGLGFAKQPQGHTLILCFVAPFIPLSVHCNGLNRDGSHRFICLNAPPIAGDTIRMYSLVGVSMSLVELKPVNFLLIRMYSSQLLQHYAGMLAAMMIVD